MARVESIAFGRPDLRGLVHAIVQEDFKTNRRLSLLRWACVVETERTGEYRDLSRRWILSPSSFWSAALRKLGYDADMAPHLAATLLFAGLPYLFAEPSFEHEAWVHDLTDRIIDRLIGVGPARPDDSIWRQLAEQAAEEQLAGAATQSDPASVRATIIGGAASIVIENGVDALTHRAVAERAGVALSSTTHHFGSLEEILVAACIEVYRRARTRAHDSSGEIKTFTLEQLKEGMAAYPGGSADVHAEIAAIHEVMTAIARSESVRWIATGLLAQIGRTSTKTLAAMTPKRGETDRLDGQIFAFVMMGHFLLSACEPARKRSSLANGLEALIKGLWV